MFSFFLKNLILSPFLWHFKPLFTKTIRKRVWQRSQAPRSGKPSHHPQVNNSAVFCHQLLDISTKLKVKCQLGRLTNQEITSRCSSTSLHASLAFLCPAVLWPWQWNCSGDPTRSPRTCCTSCSRGRNRWNPVTWEFSFYVFIFLTH